MLARGQLLDKYVTEAVLFRYLFSNFDSNLISCLVVHFAMSLGHKHSNEDCHQEANTTEVEEESARANKAEDDVGGLNSEEDHEEAEGDEAGVDEGLEVRWKPFSYEKTSLKRSSFSSLLPMRIQGKLTIATPTQNMNKMRRMVMTQLIIISSNLTPDSFMMTIAPRVPMINVTNTLVVRYIVLRPYLGSELRGMSPWCQGLCT